MTAGFRGHRASYSGPILPINIEFGIYVCCLIIWLIPGLGQVGAFGPGFPLIVVGVTFESRLPLLRVWINLLIEISWIYYFIVVCLIVWRCWVRKALDESASGSMAKHL